MFVYCFKVFKLSFVASFRWILYKFAVQFLPICSGSFVRSFAVVSLAGFVPRFPAGCWLIIAGVLCGTFAGFWPS